jgi:predicted permease
VHHPGCFVFVAGGLVLRFVASPLLILAVSYAFGLRGIALKSVVVQGALPQAIASFAVCAGPKTAQNSGIFHPFFLKSQMLISTV